MLAALAMAGSAALAAAAVDPTAAPRWSLDWSPRTDSSIPLRDPRAAQPYAPKRQTSRIARHGTDGSTIALDHEFRDLDLPQVGGAAPATNGYVHRLILGWQHDGANRRLTLGAGLAVSSNALKDPDSLRASDLRPRLAASTRWGGAGERSDTWLGLRIDDRLGALRVLPTIELHWRPTPTQVLAVGFPDSAWHWQLSPRWRTALTLGPDGGCWQVRDRARTQRTRACNDAWQGAWRLDWQPAHWARVGLEAGRRSAADLDYTLESGRAVQVEAPAAWFGAVHLGLSL